MVHVGCFGEYREYNVYYKMFPKIFTKAVALRACYGNRALLTACLFISLHLTAERK